MPRRKKAAEAVQPTPAIAAEPPPAEIPPPQHDVPLAEETARTLLADPFPIRTVNLGGYKVHLQQSRQAGEMQIRFGDGTEKDKPSGKVLAFIKSHKLKVETKDGPKEVQLFHWNEDDRAWGLRIDRERPETTRQTARRIFEDVVGLLAEERGITHER